MVACRLVAALVMGNAAAVLEPYSAPSLGAAVFMQRR